MRGVWYAEWWCSYQSHRRHWIWNRSFARFAAAAASLAFAFAAADRDWLVLQPSLRPFRYWFVGYQIYYRSRNCRCCPTEQQHNDATDQDILIGVSQAMNLLLAMTQTIQ